MLSNTAFTSGSFPDGVQAGFNRLEHLQKSTRLAGELPRLFFAGQQKFDLCVHRAHISHGCDHRAAVRQEHLKSAWQRIWTGGARIGGSRRNPGNGPNQAGEGHVAIILCQQRRPANRQRQVPGAVDHAADDARILDIGNGYRVDAQDGDAHGSVFHRNIEDFNALVAVHRLADLPQIGLHPLMIEVSHQHLRVMIFPACGRWPACPGVWPTRLPRDRARSRSRSGG